MAYLRYQNLPPLDLHVLVCQDPWIVVDVGQHHLFLIFCAMLECLSVLTIIIS